MAGFPQIRVSCIRTRAGSERGKRWGSRCHWRWLPLWWQSAVLACRFGQIPPALRACMICAESADAYVCPIIGTMAPAARRKASPGRDVQLSALGRASSIWSTAVTGRGGAVLEARKQAARDPAEVGIVMSKRGLANDTRYFCVRIIRLTERRRASKLTQSFITTHPGV